MKLKLRTAQPTLQGEVRKPICTRHWKVTVPQPSRVSVFVHLYSPLGKCIHLP